MLLDIRSIFFSYLSENLELIIHCHKWDKKIMLAPKIYVQSIYGIKHTYLYIVINEIIEMESIIQKKHFNRFKISHCKNKLTNIYILLRILNNCNFLHNFFSYRIPALAVKQNFIKYKFKYRMLSSKSTAYSARKRNCQY